jgi:hypothetical protein
MPTHPEALPLLHQSDRLRNRRGDRSLLFGLPTLLLFHRAVAGSDGPDLRTIFDLVDACIEMQTFAKWC